MTRTRSEAQRPRRSRLAALRPLRSLRNRVTIIFALIVAGAIGSMYVYVLPQLEEQLIAQKLDRLERDAQRFSPSLQGVVFPGVEKSILNRRVRAAAARSSAEVTVLKLVKGTRNQVYVAADSNEGGVNLEDVRTLGEQAALRRRRVSATQPTSVGRRALAAEPLLLGKRVLGVAVFVDALTEVQANVQLIRRRILVSGGVALVLAALAGYLVARALTNRIKRLEQAARKVAAGDFSNPIRADSDDELGRLAAAFDDMQEQLARLDTARKQFIASASHELRTPIFSLGGFLELLEDEDLDEETRAQFLAQLSGQVARLRKLATELLDLSRLESGAVELRRRADRRRPPHARRRGRVHPRRGAPRGDGGAGDRQPPDPLSVRPRAGRPGHADPARQRARPHADRHRDRGFGRRARTGKCGWRSPTPVPASSARPCRTSSSPSTPRRTARAARGSGSPSPASSRSRCTAT